MFDFFSLRVSKHRLARLLPAVALAVTLLGGCSSGNPAGGNSSGQPQVQGRSVGAGAGGAGARREMINAIPVEVAAADSGEISSFLYFTSTLETETSVEIFPQIGGMVAELFVEEGQKVRQGDVLLRLEDDELRVELMESRIQLEHLETSFRRTEQIYRGKLINEQEYETQKFQLEQARLRTERARVRLDHTMIRAPVSGVITERLAQIGARVGANTRLFAIMKMDEMIARVHVPGKYLPVVRDLQAAELTSEFLGDTTFSGWVKRISPTVDPRSGTFRVTIGVHGESPLLRPGLFVNVKIITETRDSAILVPKQAVVYEGGEKFIFLVQDDRAQKIRLNAGFENARFVESRSGVPPGSQVIILGQNGLRDQTTVRVVNAVVAASSRERPEVGEE